MPRFNVSWTPADTSRGAHRLYEGQLGRGFSRLLLVLMGNAEEYRVDVGMEIRLTGGVQIHSTHLYEACQAAIINSSGPAYVELLDKLAGPQLGIKGGSDPTDRLVG